MLSFIRHKSIHHLHKQCIQQNKTAMLMSSFNTYQNNNQSNETTLKVYF